MVKMATMTIVDELKVHDCNGVWDLEPQPCVRYNNAVDTIRDDEYPMLRGTVLPRHRLPLLTQLYRKYLPGPCRHKPLRKVSNGRIFERYDG